MNENYRLQIKNSKPKLSQTVHVLSISCFFYIVINIVAVGSKELSSLQQNIEEILPRRCAVMISIPKLLFFPQVLAKVLQRSFCVYSFIYFIDQTFQQSSAFDYLRGLPAQAIA